ncbi:hypothetical protein [Paenibacillus sp. FSL M7-1046]|uniref:hypothetical protein n=1 Tax=Paenibacillus sp. FSL M7-1046 TaxID=2975315 RepID=UPI0030FC10BB
MLPWEPMLFMFFSTIELMSIYYLIMSLFRFKWKHHAWQALFVTLIINLQSYLVRKELDMSNIAPLILIVIFILFFAAVVRMPLILSVIATISGYAIFAVIQTVIVLILFGSIGAIEGEKSNGYILQVLTSVVICSFFWHYYRKGKGFTFDIEKLRFKLEDIFLTTIIIIFLIGMSILLYYNEIYLNILFFLVISIFFIYYSIGKEKEND